jgi:DNA-binding NarL/FixJ family response regulator
MMNEMISAGADGYVIKNIERQELTAAIKAVHSGKNFYCATASTKLMTSAEEILKAQKAAGLNEREKELIRYISLGMSNKQIADELHLSVRTIESQRLKLLEKLDLKTPIDVAVFAVKQGYFKIG